MTKRQLHLEHIRIEVAREGRVTPEALRHFLENRISMKAFNEAVDLGMRQYQNVRKSQAKEQIA